MIEIEKYQRNSTLLACAGIMFCACLGVGLCLFPIACQSIKFDNQKISLYCWFIKIRSFSWVEVCEIGSAYSSGKSAYVEVIYIAKRPVSNKERFNINGVKDKKNFITMENSGNII
nr:hypothetical protein [uncultured Caproiciproducens sp.]